MAERAFKARKAARPRRTGEQPAPPDPRERDENGLSGWDKWQGRQVACGACGGSRCGDRCSLQSLPDTLADRAARASQPGAPVTVEEWVSLHPDWIGWELHSTREDVAPVLARQQARWVANVAALRLGLVRGLLRLASGERTPDQEWPARERRRIPLDVALAQATLLVAPEARSQAEAEAVTPADAEARAAVAPDGRPAS